MQIVNLSSIIQNLFKGMLGIILIIHYNYITSDGPIKVQMKCSQVTRQVFCRFYFQNTADEDYYILEDNTPLEGLYYPYLTISQGDKVIKYRGIHVSRMAPTKDSYVLIEAGKTITSPVVDLTSSYKFDSDGIYTIEYTKPFMYISDAEMSMIDDNKNLPQPTGYDDLVASTEIELRDTYYLKPTDYEVQMANRKFKEKTFLDDDQTVYISDGCVPATDFNDVDKLPTQSRRQMVSDVTELHNQLCEVGFPKAVADATSNSDKAPYIDYFGTASNRDVLSVLNEIMTDLHRPRRRMIFTFRASDCKFTTYAYAYYGSYEISLCKRFEKAPKYSKAGTFGTDHNSKFQVLAHEYSHAFGDTDDIRYGYRLCRSRKTLSAAKAIKNGDSYGYYIQDVYDATVGKK